MHSLAACKPETVRGAREALRVALEILANRAIDQGFSVTMNDGPVLDILGNVYHVLQGIDGDLRPIDD